MPDEVRSQIVPNGVAIVCISGDLDGPTLAALKREIDQLLALPVRSLILDVGDFGSMTSTGLGIMIGFCKRTATGSHNLLLATSSSRVRRIWEITGLSRVFRVHGSVAEALESVRQSG